MVTRSVKNADDLTLLITYLKGRKRPLTVDITEGRDRSGEQNRLAFKWYGEISEQTGEDREDVRARCKLEIGVPILREAHEKIQGDLRQARSTAPLSRKAGADPRYRNAGHKPDER